MPNKILLVEDQAVLAMSESRMIEKHGYTVVTVFTGEQAVAIAANDQDIDLILMDINLGHGMDGTEAAQTILQKRSMPIIFLSSYTDPEVVKKTETITAYGYVVKNTGETVLINAIKMAYRLHSSFRKEQESEARFRSMVENSPDPMIIHIDFKLVFLNPAALQLLGASSEDELIGMSILDRIDKKFHEKAIDRIKNMSITHRAMSNRIEQQYIRLDGSKVWVEVSGIPIHYQGSIGILTTVRDINERILKEQQLRESRESLRITLNSIGDAVISTDIDGRVVRMNPVAEQLTGWGLAEARERDLEEVFQIIDASSRQRSLNPVKRVLQSGQTVGLNNHTILVSRNGTEHQIADSAAPIKDSTDTIGGVVLVFRDVTEEYRKAQELQESRDFLDAVFSSIQDGVSVLDTDLTIKYANPVMQKWHQEKMPILGKKCFDAFHDSETFCKTCPSLNCMESGKTEMDVLQLYSETEKRYKWIEIYSYPFREKETGVIRGVIEFIRDITERKNAEKELLSAVEEKELLMRELNHRVKNNLAIISSLLQIETSRMGGDIDLSDIISRIDAIRIIHEKLYQSDKITHIQLKDYIQDLLETVFSSFSERQITIHNDIENILIPTKPAVSLGLIINEIAVNALKHGFTKDIDPEFSVALHENNNDGEYLLTLSNTGAAFPEDVDIRNPKSLGLQLVTTLCEQLDGSLELQKKPYPVFRVRFRIEKDISL